MKANRASGLIIFGLCLALVPELASAATSNVDSILTTFSNASSGWASKSIQYGEDIFGLLAAIEFAWTWVLYVLEKGGGEDDPIPILIRKIMSIGFFYWILISGPTLLGKLIDGFVYLGNNIGGLGANTTTVSIGGASTQILDPGWIFNQGLVIATALDNAAMKQTSMWHPLTSMLICIVVGLSMLIVIAAFAMIAAQLLITLIEAFIVVGAGLVFLGFGGSRWTLPFMEKYVGYSISIGIKLFMLYLIVAFGSTLSQEWVTTANAVGSNLESYFGVALDAVIYLFIAWKVPDFASSLMNGTPQASLGGAIQTVAGLAAAGAGVAAAAVTGGASMVGAAAGVGEVAGTLGRAGMEAAGHVGQGFSAGGMPGAMSGLGDVGAAMGGMARDAASSSVAGLSEKYVPPRTPLGGRLGEAAASRGWGGGSGGPMPANGPGQANTAKSEKNGVGASSDAPGTATNSAGGGLGDAVAAEAAGASGGEAGATTGATSDGTAAEAGNMGATDTGADSAAQDANNVSATQAGDASNTQAEESAGAPPPQTDGATAQNIGADTTSQENKADNGLGAGTTGADSAAQDANNASETATQDQTNTTDTNAEAAKADNVVDMKTAKAKGRTPGNLSKTFQHLKEAQEALPPDQTSAGNISIRFDME